MNALNEYAKINGCKRIEQRLDGLSSDSASDVFLKAELYRLYECSKLSGTSKEVEKTLDEKVFVEKSIEDIYMAY